MFARDTCYFFVRPKRNSLEVCVFLGREVKAPQVRQMRRRSKTKVAHILKITHRDQVESPITDWLQEAYELPDKKVAVKKNVAVRKNARAKKKVSGRRR
jgi:hypothetical protein